jgi:hypothetical protein
MNGSATPLPGLIVCSSGLELSFRIRISGLSDVIKFAMFNAPWGIDMLELPSSSEVCGPLDEGRPMFVEDGPPRWRWW